ncbi:MAG: hypothetical protein WBO24_03585, partial [Nitrospirales bacterium]
MSPYPKKKGNGKDYGNTGKRGKREFPPPPLAEFSCETVSASFRPVAVTVVCVVGFIISSFVLFMFLWLFLQELKKQEFLLLVWDCIGLMTT